MTAAMDVLIVEDEILLAMDLEAMIEDSGHHVLAGATCLREVEALPDRIVPQLAFVDIHLADDSTGFDVCRHIQARWPDALIVFVTANVAKIPADFPCAHGVIAKPFSHAGVVNAINYLAEGIFDPPPRLPRPASLMPTPILARRWVS